METELSVEQMATTQNPLISKKISKNNRILLIIQTIMNQIVPNKYEALYKTEIINK